MNNRLKTQEELFIMGNAICYSGYRRGQSPVVDINPTYDQVKEDLLLLEKNWNYIRLYDSSKHAATVLKVIHKEKIDLKVMVGICLNAEMNNDGCPWGSHHSDEQLKLNKEINEKELKTLIKLANHYKDIVAAVSVGNEASVDWTDHLVEVASIIDYVKMVKKVIAQPVTFCENYIPWQDKLVELAEVVDFISVHTYPIWEAKSIEESLEYTIENYNSVKRKYPHKEVVITEAGWATKSNGRGIPVHNANEVFQKRYYEKLTKWSAENGVLTFVFEAFDEDWKGSHDPLEPEKHWGLFTIDRKSKLVMQGEF
jgi:exo-beta-1,3-glucanase (GH17 family)